MNIIKEYLINWYWLFEEAPKARYDTAEHKIADYLQNVYVTISVVLGIVLVVALLLGIVSHDTAAWVTAIAAVLAWHKVTMNLKRLCEEATSFVLAAKTRWDAERTKTSTETD
jgi:hypothetical protein